MSFASIGAVSTAISIVLFLMWRGPLGPVAANAAAVTSTFVANTWLHARLTARQHRPRWLIALGVYLGSLALTSAALLGVLALSGGLAVELGVLAVTWTAATFARLVLQGSPR